MYKIHNVLSNDERKKLIKDVQPFLRDSKQINIQENNSSMEKYFPGKQSHSVLHLNIEFVPVMNKIRDKIKKEIKLDLEIVRSWVLWSNGRKDQSKWHHHYLPEDPYYDDASFSSVYYLKTLPFFSNGTLFEDGMVRAPQNSMIIFPAHLLHKPPTNPFPFIERYVMGIDFKFRNSK